MSNKRLILFYSVLAIIPLGLPIAIVIYGIQNKEELKTKIRNFKLRI